MLLSSSLEANGPRSKTHYVVLHHNNKRQLVKLPPTYSDLKKEVKRVFHVDPHGFSVETKDLNICAGEMVSIPEEAWSDVAELLGNVYVVLEAVEHPECPPETENTTRRSKYPDALQSQSTDIVADLEADPHQRSIYQQVVECDSQVSMALETVRKEVISGKCSSSGIKWKGKRISLNEWSTTDWSIRSHSVFVIRYTFSKASTTQLDVGFSPRSTANSLTISLFHNRSVLFGEQGEKGGGIEVYHTISLSHSMHTAGEHSVALVNHRGRIHVVFDFRQAMVLERTTMLKRKPKELQPRYRGILEPAVVIDVYEFEG